MTRLWARGASHATKEKDFTRSLFIVMHNSTNQEISRIFLSNPPGPRKGNFPGVAVEDLAVGEPDADPPRAGALFHRDVASGHRRGRLQGVHVCTPKKER